MHVWYESFYSMPTDTLGLSLLAFVLHRPKLCLRSAREHRKHCTQVWASPFLAHVLHQLWMLWARVEFEEIRGEGGSQPKREKQQKGLLTSLLSLSPPVLNYLWQRNAVPCYPVHAQDHRKTWKWVFLFRKACSIQAMPPSALQWED